MNLEYKSKIFDEASIISKARNVFDAEIEALAKTRGTVDGNFVQIIEQIISCRGKLVIIGMGKSGHIAAKLAATFASLGTPAFRLHPAEAMHGDLGMVSSDDVVIAISFSGASEEILRIIPSIKIIGAKLIAITGNKTSTLARAADFIQIIPDIREACHLGMAPTSSTTAALCYGDALAVVASWIYGFKESDFAVFHPAGSLGKKLLLHVDDLMAKGNDIPTVVEKTVLIDAIAEMSRKRLGLVSIIDHDEKLSGILTDGDLRLLIERKIDIYNVNIEEVMNKTPKFIHNDALAIDALRLMKDKNINNMPVVDYNDKLIGTITLQQIVKAGLVL